MAFIQSVTKKEADSQRLLTKRLSLISLSAGVICVAIGLFNFEEHSKVLVLGIILILFSQFLRFIQWIDFNNAKQIEETDDRPKKQ